MPLGFLIWLMLGVLVGLVWAVRLAMLGSILRKRSILHSASYDGPPEPSPRVTVLVAAKDEEDNIEVCIETMLKQDYPNFEIVAIDDRSGDRTPAILRRLAQRAGGKLRVVTVTQLREGWFGKSNAMREGVSIATGDWLCFTDADCRQTSTKTLTVAMQEVLAKNIDFLSITPLLETKAAWERMTQPVCAFVLMLWFLPQRVNDPSKKTAYANGAFMLMRRRCYEAIGGHERVRTEINEDIQMARIAKRTGFGLRVCENDDLYSTRMYRTMGDSWRGWSRIFYGSLATLPRLLIAAAALAGFALGPWVSTAAALIGRWSASAETADMWSLMLGIWACTLCLMQVVLWRLYPVLKISHGWSLTYPFGASIALGMLGNAMLKVVGATGTTWRGTRYRGQVIDPMTHNQESRDPEESSPVEETVADG